MNNLNEDLSLNNTPEEAFNIISRINQLISVGGKKVQRLEVEHLDPFHFHEKYGLTPLVNFFNSLSDHICDSDGKVLKEFRKDSPHVVDWYERASKYIRVFYRKGVRISVYKNDREKYSNQS